MKRHTKEHIFESFHRITDKRIKMIKEIFNAGSRPDNEPRFDIPPRGRLNKYTHSCDCRMCIIDRSERRFRTHKHATYREMDRYDTNKYEGGIHEWW